MVGRFLLRVVLVPLGAAMAIAVAAAFVLIARWNALVAVLDAGPQAQQDYLFAFLLGAPLLTLLLSVWSAYTLAPAAAGVLIAEAFAIRSWIFHAGNGGLSAWIGWALTRDIRDEYHLFADPKVLVAAGLAGGFTYWAVAGWTAGFWKPIRALPPPRPLAATPPPPRPPY